ncbi:MAG: carboxypeptidase regulatory-like domain-containing protein [Myxococcales bacterium]|nr:carboxypeptidase regulatory-like domain-containing protein [Myxococcales bacterium]
MNTRHDTASSPPRRSSRFAVAAMLVALLGLGLVVFSDGDAALVSPSAQSGPPDGPDLDDRASTPEAIPVVAGHLLNQDDRGGIAGGTISARCGKAQQTVITRDGGAFAFRTLPAGKCVLSASAPGHVNAGPQLEVSVEIEVDPSEPYGDLELRLYSAATVEGTVRRAIRGTLDPVAQGASAGQAPRGLPVPGARLSLLYDEAPGADGPFALSAEVVSDDEGHFRLDGVGPGRLRILAEHDDYGAAESLDRFIRPGDHVTDMDVDLSPTGIVRGVVRLRGVAVVGARVGVQRPGEARAYEAVSGADGAYVVTEVPAGELTVVASAYGAMPGIMAKRALEAESELVLDFALEARPGVGGRVLSPDGEPTSGATIEVRSSARGPAEERVASERDGTFWLDRLELANGQRVLLATHPEYGPSAPVLVPRAGESVVLQLTAGGRLSGNLVDSRGAPVQTFVMTIIDADRQFSGGRRTVVRDPRGAFTSAALGPGRYFALLAREDGAGVVESEPVVVAAGRTTHIGTLRLAAAGGATGRVVDETGRAIRGVSVAIEGPLGGGRVGASASGPDGTFHIGSLPTGSTLLFAQRGLRTRLLSRVTTREGDVLELGDIVMTRSAGKEGGIQYSGVGMRLGMGDDGAIRVLQVFDGSPAAGAGLPAGATVLSVGGYETSRMTISKVVELIRGEVGSEVTVQVALEDGTRRTLKLVRSEVLSN